MRCNILTVYRICYKQYFCLLDLHKQYLWFRVAYCHYLLKTPRKKISLFMLQMKRNTKTKIDKEENCLKIENFRVLKF